MDVSSYAEKISRAYKGGKITANHARKLCGLPPMQDPGMDELVQMYDETVDGMCRLPKVTSGGKR